MSGRDALASLATWLLNATHLDPLALLGALALWLGALTLLVVGLLVGRRGF